MENATMNKEPVTGDMLIANIINPLLRWNPSPRPARYTAWTLRKLPDTSMSSLA